MGHELRAAIRNVKIHDFRSVDRLELSFVDPNNKPCQLVVIAGPNGSGKTSVLEACLIASQRLDLIKESTPERAKQLESQDFQIEAELEIGGAKIHTSHHGIRSSKKERIDGSGSIMEPMNVPCVYFSSWRAPKLVGPVSITAGKKGKRPQPTDENRLWLVKQFLVNARAHESLGQRISMIGASPYEDLINQLTDIWALFHPGSEATFTVESVSEDPSAGFDVYLVDGQNKRVAIDVLSSGELELFNFVAWMLVERFRGGIVFIDEPELHLDPQWHTVLLDALRKLQPESQFIVATHSPEIYESAMSFERHLLIPPNDPRMKYWRKSAG